MRAQHNTSLFFDFYGIGERSVRTNISKEVDKAIGKAMRSAKLSVSDTQFTMAASTALNEPSVLLVVVPKHSAPQALHKFKECQPNGLLVNKIRF